MTPGRPINIFFLVMINLATILSIKNWPITAALGASSAFFLVFGAIIFFIPVSLVAAELASGWPERGGIFAWVKTALGHEWGFLSVWLLWLENIVWYPTILSFIAGTLAFIINPVLATNSVYTFCVIFIIFWGLTLLNLRGVQTTGWISTISMIFGTLLPGILIISLGALWHLKGRESFVEFSWGSAIPSIGNMTQLSVLAGIVLGYGGMEMPAVHAKDVINPKKNYPKAIFLSAFIIVILWVLGSLAIAIVIPQKEINLLSGSIEAISKFFTFYHLESLIPIIAILVAVGALGGVSTWIGGPCRGVLAAAQEGDLPKIFHKTNKHNMPVSLMIFQGVVVTLLSLVFLILPDVNASFWILVVLASQLYLIMYGFMFISGIILRYKKKNVHRVYRIPFGNVGMWVVGIIGLLSCAFCFIVGFIPPAGMQQNVLFFESFLIGGIAIFCALPFIILQFKKKSWVSSSK
ncbi:MAG: amino acid permease [Chlamydiales bacterium]|nr:amino acid permease [Chlamydiales bacterium]